MLDNNSGARRAACLPGLSSLLLVRAASVGGSGAHAALNNESSRVVGHPSPPSALLVHCHAAPPRPASRRGLLLRPHPLPGGDEPPAHGAQHPPRVRPDPGPPLLRREGRCAAFPAILLHPAFAAVGAGGQLLLRGGEEAQERVPRVAPPSARREHRLLGGSMQRAARGRGRLSASKRRRRGNREREGARGRKTAEGQGRRGGEARPSPRLELPGGGVAVPRRLRGALGDRRALRIRDERARRCAEQRGGRGVRVCGRI